MESLGEKLRAAREEKGMTIDQVGRETNITVRYIEALETENFGKFPGETYITGFLRSYGNFLNLNVQELLSLYRAHKIQEQPIPVEQLLKPPSKLPKILITAGIILAVLGCGVGITYYIVSKPKKPAEAVTVSHSRTEHIMNDSSLERRLYTGDSILIPVETSQYKVELSNLGDAVTISTPAGPVILDLSQEANVDLNNDGIPDLLITVIDFVKNNTNMGVLLRLDRAAVVPGDFVPETEIVEGTAGVPASSRMVISSPNAHPFTLQVSFRGYCMFRWEILFERDRRDRNERYFQRSDELNIQAQNGIRIWASNAQAARFQVIAAGQTVPVELGASGEVVVADLRWLRDENNQFRLVLTRLES